MTLDPSAPWLVILGLGVWHGINPAMGWLFAVALGLQEGERGAVWRALPPLALGHGIAIGGAIALAALIGLVIPLGYLKWIVACLLFGIGLYRLIRNRHPRFGGMRVGARDLTIWSMLMASAHGAGLMVVPFVLGAGTASGAREAHAAHGTRLSGLAGDQLTGVIATLIHTFGYLLVVGLVAVVVYEKLGLRLLRGVWFNMDLAWGVALIATAILTPLI